MCTTLDEMKDIQDKVALQDRPGYKRARKRILEARLASLRVEALQVKTEINNNQ